MAPTVWTGECGKERDLLDKGLPAALVLVPNPTL